MHFFCLNFVYQTNAVAMTTTCWVLTDGKMGCRRQAMGLAKALPWQWSEKVACRRRPFYWLPASWHYGSLKQLTKHSDALQPPWPNWVISCGYRAVPLSLAIKAASGEQTRLIHVQNPRINLSHFDWVIAADHDHLAGPNVLTHLGALHDLNPNELSPTAPMDQNHHVLTIVVGGHTKHQRLGDRAITQLTSTLREMAQQWPGQCRWVTSRRTPSKLVKNIQQLAIENAGEWVDPTQRDGYRNALRLANTIVVTNDSSSMTTECTASGKPVYSLPLPQFKPKKKHQEMIKSMINNGLIKRYSGSFDDWSYPPHFEAKRIADAILQHLH
jgi:mitochondrial fission protein ELM1